MKKKILPSSKWKKAILKDLVFFQRGFDITKADQNGGDIPVISSSGITSYHSRSMVKGPGIIIGRKGTLGTVFYSETDYWPHDTTLWSKRLNNNYPRFVYYFVKTLRLENYNVGNANPTLNRNHIHKLQIRIPEKPKQENSARILCTYDDFININRRRIQLLEEAARLLYREWFIYFRFPGHEKVKMIDGVPEGWKKEKLNQIISFLGGHAFKSSSYQQEGKYGIVTIKNVQQGSFISKCTDYLEDPPDTIKKHCFLYSGDILLSLTGNVGRVCLVYGKNYLLNQRVAKIEPTNTIPKSFAYWMFNDSMMQKRIENFSSGSAQQNLSPVKLGEQKVILPPIPLLESFDNLTSLINIEIIQLLNQNQKLTQARDLLLPRLMNGTIEV